jgi:chemotaxis protein CheC
LIFPEASSLELVRVVVGRQLSLEDIVNLEDEVLAETGNIILNSWVATIANLLQSV